MYQVMSPLPSSQPVCKEKKKRTKTNNWKQDSRGGPRGRGWVGTSTSLGKKAHPVLVESEELEQHFLSASLSQFQSLELCCSDNTKRHISFSHGVSALMHFPAAIKWLLFLTLHIAFKEPHQQRLPPLWVWAQQCFVELTVMKAQTTSEEMIFFPLLSESSVDV